MKITKRNISSLIFAEYNPRKLTKNEHKELKDSLIRFGLVEPVIINSNPERKDIIIGGHQRARIWKELGNKKIEVVEWNLTYDKERELNVRLNKNTGSWDFDELANNFDLDELKEWGFQEKDLFFEADDLEDGLIDDDAIPEAQKKRVKLGDIWKLGNHRLLCGDSFKEDDVKKLMRDKNADLIFSDIPYDLTDFSFLQNFEDSIENGFIFIWADDQQIQSILQKTKMKLQRFFILDHTFSSPKGNDVYVRHILLMRFKKGKTISFKNLNDGFQSILKFDYRGNLKKKEDVIHKHQKPVNTIIKFLLHYSNENFIVQDLFLGSGSTLIACEKTNRICFGMELSEDFCNLILERWEKFTGKKATKIND
tara:strand:+ start:127 stop:1227 length:1101 start_codon:yes stop_codon:yes gene_type:complete